MKKKSSRRAKALDIDKKTKERVWQRDGERCILCGNHEAMPNAHYIPRSAGGLGIEQNIVTLCSRDHFRFDQTTERETLREQIKHYLKSCYPDWDEKKLYYRKYEGQL